jgi:sterol desaturase/sphingolipid hydroxylase (fatty acid hydroxylase superfamily)
MDAIVAVGSVNALAWGWRQLIRPLTGLPLAAAYVILIRAWLPNSTFEYSWDCFLLHFVSLIVLVDAVQYAIHMLAHKVEFLRHSHAKHHKHTSPSVEVAFETGLVDAICQVLLPVTIAIFLVHPSRTVLVAFGAAYSTWLQYIHSPLRAEISSLLVGPRYHAIHHRYPTKNMGHVFTCWDQFFGTQLRS